MAVVGWVRELWSYPVKSLAGSPVEALRVGPGGVDGDRAWALVNAETGRPISARREPRLLLAAAGTVDGRLVLDLPGLGPVPAARAGEAASAWLGRPVRLAALPAAELGFVDEAPLHLLTDATLLRHAREHPGSDWSVRRFRPNAVIASADGVGDSSGCPEDGWVGARLRLGTVTTRVTDRTIRCAVITLAQPGLAADPSLLRSLAERGHDLGLYADVLDRGTVRVGDAVRVEHAGSLIGGSGQDEGLR